MSEIATNNLVKVTLALLGIIQAGVFFIITSIYRDIDSLETLSTKEMRYNTETFARKDDVAGMEKKILKAIDDLSKKLD